MLLALHVTIDINFDTYLSSICQIVHCKVTLSFLSHTVLFTKKSLRATRTLGANSYTPPPWKQSVYTNDLEFFSIEDLFLLSHLFVYSFIYFSLDYANL